MRQYRQNIQKAHSKCLNNDVESEYGINPLNVGPSKKDLKSKSKSNKDILIAKNKKLPEMFNISNRNNSKDKQLKFQSRKKAEVQSPQKQAFQKSKKTKRSNQKKDGRDDAENMKTSYFGVEQYESKQLRPQLKETRYVHKVQTYASDRQQAQQLRQRLKKSTSMKTLIQQHFLSQKCQKQNDRKNIYTEQQRSNNQNYDSTKYNWRLSKSKSKEKLMRQKSLSALSGKAKLLCELKHVEEKRNKLVLDSDKKIDSKQINGSDKKPINQSSKSHDQKISHHSHKMKVIQLPNKLAFTFGSDVVNSHCFN